MRLLEGDAGTAGSLREMSIAELAAPNPKLDAAAFSDELRPGARHGCKPFDLQAFREGHLTPVFFGSALKNFGVGDLLDALGAIAPPPRAQEADKRAVTATEPALSAFVFKMQANMDPNHRDRIAFVRLCSGKLTRGMKVTQVRTGKTMSLHAPQFFFAQDRALAEEAYAGDVVGIPNHGSLRIGDTLTEGENLNFVGVPSFAPEILRRVRLPDAMKAKKLKQALQELAEEGVVQVFRPTDGSPALVGVVGPLQLDVLQARLAAEYGVEIGLGRRRVSAGALDRGGRPQNARAVRADLSFLDRRGSRRRSGLPRAQRLQSRLYRRAEPRHHLQRREGHSQAQACRLKRDPEKRKLIREAAFASLKAQLLPVRAQADPRDASGDPQASGR